MITACNPFTFVCNELGLLRFRTTIFDNENAQQDIEQEKQHLFAKIGQLEVERDWLKKISKQLGLPTNYKAS